MDQTTLVENQIDDGQRLIEQLIHDHVDVTAACWIKTSDEEPWFLYIASKEVDDNGLAKAYSAFHKTIQSMPDLWIDPFEVKLIGTADPVTTDVLNFQRDHLARIPTRFRGTYLGGTRIDEAYIYPQLFKP